MKSFVKLVNFEFNRFFKVFIALAGITVVSQIAGVIYMSRQYMNNANEQMYEHGLSMATFIRQTGKLSFYDMTQSIWFMGPIALCIAGLIFYSFLIWYRDWFGKNQFIYRLLMLPTGRLNIYFSKAATIFLMVLGLVALQILLLPTGSLVLKWMVPLEFRMDLPFSEMVSTFNYLTILFPDHLLDFSIHYGLGFMSIFVLFTIILFERSFRLKGVILGVLYGAFTLLIFFAPVIMTGIFRTSYLYPIEYFLLQVFLGLAIIIMSILMSRFLLNKKIRI